MMHNIKNSVVIILFFHFSQGELNFLIDGSTIELKENVVLQCQDTSKSKSIAFSYKNETDPIFNNIVNCVMTRPTCTIPDTIKYSSQKDETNAAFNEFNATIKSFSNSSFGCYRCQDMINTSAYAERCIPYNASLTEKCSSIIKCGDSNAECTGTICQCKSNSIASGIICMHCECAKIGNTTITMNWSIDKLQHLAVWKKTQKFIDPTTKTLEPEQSLSWTFDIETTTTTTTTTTVQSHCTCKGYCNATLAVFIFDCVEVITEVVIVICVVKLNVNVPLWLIWIVTILMHVNVVWSVIMDFLLIGCKGCEKDWCLALNNITLCRTFITTFMKICFLKLSRKLGKLMLKMYCCASTELDELKELACALLVIDLSPYTLGLIFLVLVYFPSGSFAKAFKSSNNGHSDRGGEKTVGVSKQKKKIGTANQQPRESEAVSSDGIELAVVNNGQEKPMLRPQPPLSGIGKSHQQVDEPHHKKTRGLSSNFEDPNSLPQKEVRKDSLAPMIENMEGDSDSNSKEKEDEKEEKRGK